MPPAPFSTGISNPACGWCWATRRAACCGRRRWRRGAVELGAGWIAGGVAQVVAQNLAGAAASDLDLAHVRSDYALYAEEGWRNLAMTSLYAERIWSLAPDVFARATVGYLEPMFAGVSGEVLWRPYDQPYAIGLDINYRRAARL